MKFKYKMLPQERFKIIICGNQDDEPGIILTIKDIVIELVQQNKTKISPNLIGLANNYLRSQDDLLLITNFIDKSNKYWDQISARDETFFIKHAGDIFGGLPENHIDSVRQLFKDDILEDEDKEILWEYFKILVKISIHFIHESRIPKMKNSKPIYTKNAYSDIKLNKLARQWNVKLKWDL